MADDGLRLRFFSALRRGRRVLTACVAGAGIALTQAAHAQVQNPVLYPQSADCTQTTQGGTDYVTQLATCQNDVSQSGALPFTASYSNGQDVFGSPSTIYALSGNVSGVGASSGNDYMLFYGSFGQPPNETYKFLPIWTDGSAVTVTNTADLTWTNAVGSNSLINLATKRKLDPFQVPTSAHSPVSPCTLLKAS